MSTLAGLFIIVITGGSIPPLARLFAWFETYERGQQ